MVRPPMLTLLTQHKFRSVEASICDSVPNRWNNMAVNCITMMNAKKNTNTKPMGSKCKYSLLTMIWKNVYRFTLQYYLYVISLRISTSDVAAIVVIFVLTPIGQSR